jgi:DNA modification methylase
VSARLGRNAIGIDLSPEYLEIAERRVAPYRDQARLDLATVDPASTEGGAQAGG